MLGTTLWFVVVIGLLAAALLNGAAAFGRAGVQAAANPLTGRVVVAYDE